MEFDSAVKCGNLEPGEFPGVVVCDIQVLLGIPCVADPGQSSRFNIIQDDRI